MEGCKTFGFTLRRTCADEGSQDGVGFELELDRELLCEGNRRASFITKELALSNDVGVSL